MVLGLSTLVSSAVLLLLTSLRDTYNASPEKKSVLGETYVGMLDATSIEESGPKEIFSSSLQVILKGWRFWITLEFEIAGDFLILKDPCSEF